MRLPFAFVGLLCAGCSINKLIPPPYAGAIVDHERFFGLNAKVPYGAGAVVEVQLGWGSHVWCLIPVSTNDLHTASISDTFKLSQSISPLDTAITEDLQTGWSGQPPAPRFNRIFDPKSSKFTPLPPPPNR